MGKEYIERGAALAKAEENAKRDWTYAVHIKTEIEKVLSETPTADVAPVVHGRWEKWIGDNRHHCNVCECYANAQTDSYGYIAEEFLDNYCSNCGANMDLEDIDGQSE